PQTAPPPVWVQTLGEASVQVKSVSTVQVEEQPSPFSTSPSSQFSPVSLIPLPQVGPLQTPRVWRWSVVVSAEPSSQVLPAASYWQVALQQSPAVVLPSSHCSPSSTVPSPHTGSSWQGGSAAGPAAVV